MTYKCKTQRLGLYVDEKEIWICIECRHEKLYNFTGKRKCDVNDEVTNVKRGERKDGTVVKHCDIRIASSWNYCPICGTKKEEKVINWT